MPANPSPQLYSVDFEPIGRRIDVQPDASLLDAAQDAGVQLISLCGGIGSCDSCRVRLVSGELSPPTLEERQMFEEEELEKGYRLACQAKPASDVKIDIPPESLTHPQRLQLEGQEVLVEPDPLVIPVDVDIPPPSLEDLRSDAARLKGVFEGMGLQSPVMRLPVLRTLSDQLRTQRWSVRLALRQNEVVSILPTASPILGLAVDVGTTKLAAYLVDLSTGFMLAKSGGMNPQISYGEDVMSRIAYANQHENGRRILQDRLYESVNGIVADLCDEVEAQSKQIVDAVVVGNTAMHHLFAGFPIEQLGMAPYVPAVSDPMDISATDLGLAIAPGAYIHLPPNIAGFVGADHVAMLLAAMVPQPERTILALDIGTNTEISLALNGRLLSCSCASGPAFEGAHIRDGMRAAPGAIERVQIIEGEIRYNTIDEQPPVGICGSGILDTIAELVMAGVIDSRGMLVENHPSVQNINGQNAFLLVPKADAGHQRDIVITRKDVNEIQLAKGAIRAGIEILLQEAGLSYDAVDEFVVAGAFGTYLDVQNAVHIGMFPKLPLGRFRQIGNAAGTGARMMLVSAEQRRMATKIAREVEYLELTTHPKFTDEFMQGMGF